MASEYEFRGYAATVSDDQEMARIEIVVSSSGEAGVEAEFGFWFPAKLTAQIQESFLTAIARINYDVVAHEEKRRHGDMVKPENFKVRFPEYPSEDD